MTHQAQDGGSPSCTTHALRPTPLPTSLICHALPPQLSRRSTDPQAPAQDRRAREHGELSPTAERPEAQAQQLIGGTTRYWCARLRQAAQPLVEWCGSATDHRCALYDASGPGPATAVGMRSGGLGRRRARSTTRNCQRPRCCRGRRTTTAHGFGALSPHGLANGHWQRKS